MLLEVSNTFAAFADAPPRARLAVGQAFGPTRHPGASGRSDAGVGAGPGAGVGFGRTFGGFLRRPPAGPGHGDPAGGDAARGADPPGDAALGRLALLVRRLLGLGRLRASLLR